MASPFRIFRKHQKVLIAVAAVLCMVIFVFSDALMGLVKSAAGGGSARSPDALVASWDGGSLNVRELAILRSRRLFLNDFLRRLQMTGAQRVIADGGSPAPPNIPVFMLAENTSIREVEQSALLTRVLAELAVQAGISVSDEVINNYLGQAGFHRVSGDEILGLLKGLQFADRQANVEVLFAALRENLLAHYYQCGDLFPGQLTRMGFLSKTISYASQTILPEERWQDWRRVNNRIALDAAILPVARFVADVPEPTDAQIQAFYDLHKDRIGGQMLNVMGAVLPSPNPGFAQPRRVRLHYLLGDVFRLSEKLASTVSEEEIADYYERNKRTQFVRADTSAFEAEDENEDASESTDGSVDSGTGVDSETGADSETGDKESPETEAAPDDTPDETSNLQARSPFQLTAFQDADAPASEAESSSSAAEESAEDAGKKDASEKNTGEKDASADESADEGSNPEEDAVEYQPLEEVEDEIRRLLATDKAVLELKAKVDLLFDKLLIAYNPYGEQKAVAAAEGKDPPQAPKLLADLSTEADEQGMIFEKTALLSIRELAFDSLVGKAIDAQTGRVNVAQLMFGKLDLYEPAMAQDIDGNWYLAFKVEDNPQHVPELETIRNEVVKAWKQQEAAKLALAKAEALSAEAQSAGGTLSDFFAGKDYDTVTTDMFSWFSFGTTPQEMQRGQRLGEAPPLESVGPNFMVKAFQLKEDESIGLLNYDQTSAYVIRLHQREQSEEELRKLFLTEANSWFGRQFTIIGHLQQFQQQVFDKLTDRIGLKFEEAWNEPGR